MSQNWIVAVLVGLAALYSVWYVLPNAARRRLGRIHNALGRAPSCSSSCERCGKCSTPATGVSTAPDQHHPVHVHHTGAGGCSGNSGSDSA